MMKWLGSALAFSGCLFLGGYQERALASQRRALEETAEGLEELALRLEWSNPPLGELLDWLAQREGPLRQVCVWCKRELGEPDRPGFSTLWRQSVEKHLRLCPRGMELVSQAGDLLGQYQHQRQEEGLRALGQRLRALSQETEERRKQLGRVYWVTGGTAGLLLVLLLV